METEDSESINDKFNRLSPEAREFLTSLEADDVGLLKEGLKLINALRTVGHYMRLLILFILAIFFGIVMLWESVEKFIKLWKNTWS